MRKENLYEERRIRKAMVSQRGLAVALSELQPFSSPKTMLEQYPTDSNLAAELLWHAHIRNRIAGRRVVDLGAGTGILAVGAALLGAAEVVAIEKDADAIATMRQNLELYEGTERVSVIHADIGSARVEGDVVVMNPPFGTKERHADRVFLEKAKETAPIIYTIHKTTTRGFVEAYAKENGLAITFSEEREMPLKRSMRQHTKERKGIAVTLFCLEQHPQR